MKQRSLWIFWGVAYFVCLGLGMIPEPEEGVRVLLTAASLVFFLPPGVMVYRAHKSGDGKTLKNLRLLAVLSLGLTMVMLIGNILAAFGSEGLGNLMHVFLALVSVPMLCSNYWALSLFLWAVLLFASMQKRR